MKSLRFIHTADWHADNEPKKQAKLIASLNQIVDYCINTRIEAIIIAGDIWERSQRYQANSGVPIVIKYIKRLAELVPYIFITKGNNSHDEPGSISLLHQIKPNVYAYEYPVILAVMTDSRVVDLLRFDNLLRFDRVPNPSINYIISLVPYPTKASLLIEDSIDNNNANFLDKFEQVFEHIGEVTQPYTCPKILAFHGNVVGSRLSTGQTLVSQDIMVAPATLQKAKHDYYALGHIHLRQEVAHNMVYSGSIYNKNWGETEQKSFEIIEFNDLTMNTNSIMLSAAKAMIKLNCTFKDGIIDYETEDELVQKAIHEDAEVRLRITISENERKLITEEELSKVKTLFGADTKVEFNIIPDQRESRSEKIMNCKTLLDEVKEYAEVINQPINGTIEKKVAKIQEVQL